MKINRKKELALLVLLIIIVIYSYLNIPKSFYTDVGGSCYQGITVTINIFILKICFVLSLTALILIFFNAKIIISKIISGVSLFIWSIWTIGQSLDAKASELLYCIPFLVVAFLVVIITFNTEKLEKQV